MATYTNTAFYSSSSLALFKAWAQGFGAALTSFGWVQTADTGQVNWSTIASVPTTPPYAYEVWGMADTLQATSPIYLILYYYGQGTNNPGLDIQVCYATNGAGIAVGPSLYYPTLCYPNSDTTDTNNWMFSGSTNRFLFFNVNNVTQYVHSGSFCIERSHDSSGNDTGDYVTMIGVRYNQKFEQVFLKNGASMPTEQYITAPFPQYPGSGGSTGIGAYLTVAPAFPLIGGTGNPCLSVLVMDQNDFANGTTFNCTHYGSSHTYWVLFDTNTTNNIIWSYQYTAIGYRWE